MRKAKPIKNDFATSLRRTRKFAGLPQEAFSLVSSRTHVSGIERGTKIPTLNKVDQLAEVLGLHPLTLLTLAYTSIESSVAVQSLLDRVTDELEMIRTGTAAD